METRSPRCPGLAHSSAFFLVSCQRIRPERREYKEYSLDPLIHTTTKRLVHEIEKIACGDSSLRLLAHETVLYLSNIYLGCAFSPAPRTSGWEYHLVPALIWVKRVDRGCRRRHVDHKLVTIREWGRWGYTEDQRIATSYFDRKIDIIKRVSALSVYGSRCCFFTQLT